MRVTKKMLEIDNSIMRESINAQSGRILDLSNQLQRIRAERDDIQSAAENMLKTIGSLKQSLRFAGETIKTIAEGLPVK